MAKKALTRENREKKITAEEKKKIAKEMIEGYKKMADINRELAEEGMKADDET
jgi:hypothetical protein